MRLWILGAALGSFAAGMNLGLAAPDLFAAPDTPAADDDYVRHMIADYGLTKAQQRSLRLVLLKWREEEIEVIRAVEAAQLPENAQRGLLTARGKLEQRIRAILDEEQRARYDRATRPAQDPSTGR